MKKLLYFSMLVAVTAADAATAQTTRMMTTTESQWHNLVGKMVTMSQEKSEISFFAPYNPGLSTTRSRNATTVQYSTPAPTPAGMSVCLRYVVDNRQRSPTPDMFTLHHSNGGSLRLRIDLEDRYQVFFGGDSLYLTTDVVLWSIVHPSLWTRICLTVDSRKNVVQMFSGRKMSIRKILPVSFVPQGKPGIKFSGFDGQVTDVQMWDYPLSYKEVFAYMNFPKFRSLTGSVLKWSHISYSVSGDVLVEDTYENQAKQPFWGKLGKKKKEERMFSSVEQAETTSNQ